MKSNEEHLDGKLPPTPENPLLERVKNTFFDEYFPTAEAAGNIIFITTRQIYLNFQKIYPSESYTMENVANWMFEKGFQFKAIAGPMQYEWMLEKSTDV